MVRLVSVIIAASMIAGCSVSRPGLPASPAPPVARVRVVGIASRIVEGARAQCLSPARYTGEYFRISYPGGDVPADRGACTDVVIRALRHAGYDLQKLIHEDLVLHRDAYPRTASEPDANIDHRRVPNQRAFFSRHGRSLPVDRDWKPGDVVSWRLESGRDHVGVLSNRLNERGTPYVIHNLSRTAEEDVLRSWTITGHYRYPRER